MEQQIAVDRNLPGLEHIVNNLAILLSIIDGLIKHIVFGAVAFAVCHVTEMMRSCDKFHARVFLIGIVDS